MPAAQVHQDALDGPSHLPIRIPFRGGRMAAAADVHQMTEDQRTRMAEDAVFALLALLGNDMRREGLQDTPKRVVRALRTMCTPEPFNFTVFDSEGMNEMIVQGPSPVQSLCEHHMLPFVGSAYVAYIPAGKIVGLSKLARTVKYCSAGLQNQERITTAVADMLQHHLQPLGLGVVIRARHLCMEMRGVQVPDVYTTTSCMRGALLEDQKAREEFLRLARP
jgi:GTP cyclohydrolase I